MTDRRCWGQILRPGNKKNTLKKDRGREICETMQQDLARKKKLRAGGRERKDDRGKGHQNRSSFYMIECEHIQYVKNGVQVCRSEHEKGI